MLETSRFVMAIKCMFLPILMPFWKGNHYATVKRSYWWFLFCREKFLNIRHITQYFNPCFRHACDNGCNVSSYFCTLEFIECCRAVLQKACNCLSKVTD
jgi:hypothetical protein